MSIVIALIVGFVLLKVLKFGIRLVPYLVIGIAILVVAGALAGCATKPVETVPVVTVLPPPDVPESLLQCKAEPTIGRLESQRDAARYVLDLKEAGADCRGKLGVVGGILRSGGNSPEIPDGSK